jgi:hypothetical protein
MYVSMCMCIDARLSHNENIDDDTYGVYYSVSQRRSRPRCITQRGGRSGDIEFDDGGGDGCSVTLYKNKK